jgi:hypothetical protein
MYNINVSDRPKFLTVPERAFLVFKRSQTVEKVHSNGQERLGTNDEKRS